MIYALHTMAALFNNHPYISSSGTAFGTKFTATYVGMVTVCMALLFVYFVSQCIHWAIPTLARFLFYKSFYGDLL